MKNLTGYTVGDLIDDLKRLNPKLPVAGGTGDEHMGMLIPGDFDVVDVVDDDGDKHTVVGFQFGGDHLEAT